MISDDLMQWLDSAPDQSKLRCELDTLRAINEWVLNEVVGFHAGDVVEFVQVPNTDNGWKPYREALVVGAVADVKDVGFNRYGGYWYAEIVLRREWTVNDSNGPGSVVRRWYGPVDETPEGMEPPGSYCQEHYPQGRKHSFRMPVRCLALKDGDA